MQRWICRIPPIRITGTGRFLDSGTGQLFTGFYTDGYYYVDANGVKLKYPMPLEQIISSVQTGVNTSNMESSYMKGISLNEVNGKRVLA